MVKEEEMVVRSVPRKWDLNLTSLYCLLLAIASRHVRYRELNSFEFSFLANKKQFFPDLSFDNMASSILDCAVGESGFSSVGPIVTSLMLDIIVHTILSDP